MNILKKHLIKDKIIKFAIKDNINKKVDDFYNFGPFPVTIMMKKKEIFFVFLSILLSLILIISTLEIAVRIIVSNGLNLDIEMLKYAKSFKVISENKDVGLEHKTNIKKKLMNVDIELNSQGFRNNINIDETTNSIVNMSEIRIIRFEYFQSKDC